MDIDFIALIVAVFVLGNGFGILVFFIFQKIKKGSFQKIAQDILEKAEKEALSLKKTQEIALKQMQLDHQKELETHWANERKKIQREEMRLQQREDKLEDRMNLVEKKLSDIEKREAILSARRSELDEEKVKLTKSKEKHLQELETLSSLSANEAKKQLFEKMMAEVKTDIENHSRKIRKEAEEEAELSAVKIISTAINRLAVSTTSQTTVHTVTIPSDDLKGRIIGREGRNIRTLEQLTGVNFVIDETPGAVVLSGFDPIRIHVAKIALSELINDGRIYPTRIEEIIEKTKENVRNEIKKHGEEAAFRAGVMNLHPELINLLGKLKFRFSYGQNMLEHSLEVSYIMGLMAGELGLNVALAKRIGLLHDMGKAVSHEMEGTHAVIGHDLALKYGEKKEVANGIGCHHYEMEAITVEGSLCSAADAISASRPGARIEAVEEYIKRLSKLEEMALQFPGVEKAFAMQAGREIRAIVLPHVVDDEGTVQLTKKLTKKIEEELNYPGRIKVTVIREKRVTEYAT